jgi:hypothetical protein
MIQIFSIETEGSHKKYPLVEFEGGKGMMGEELGFWLGDHLFQTVTRTCICWWALVLYCCQQNLINT